METKRPRPQKQVGDTNHYESSIEPIEFIEANSIPFHEANVIKYVFRWRKKNGIEDLVKSHWYILRLIQLEYNILNEKDKNEFRIKYPEILQIL